ncbi:hypothetical protein F8M41_019906 [Gigaspora margarita]|uniref:Uncharacterized protein n=1 Tax=Gigaspora margarita TaxID=4874 RepID=A0A8H4EU40_GIGMA|nr:hypothetical protein F8M41_019906 [Gigaspora margarita]
MNKILKKFTILVPQYKPHNIFISIKPKDNNVVIDVGLDQNNEINQVFIKATLQYGLKICYLPSASTSILRRADDRDNIRVILFGRDNILSISSGLCSVGFLARKSCDDDSLLIGTMVLFSINKYDYGLIDISAKTKVTCGYIESFNGVYINTNNIIFIDLIFTNSFSMQGDSGGPVFYFLDLCSVSLTGINSCINTVAFVINDTTFAINAVLPLEIILAKTKLKLVTIN